MSTGRPRSSGCTGSSRCAAYRDVAADGVDEARAVVAAATLPRAQQIPAAGEPLPLSRRATFAMASASARARRVGETEVAPTHIVAALVETPGAREIPGFGDADLDALRADVQAALDH